MFGVTDRVGRIADRCLLIVGGPSDRGGPTSVRVALFAVGLSLLHASGPPASLLSDDWMDWQERHLLDANPAPPGSHGAKLAFRLTMPILGRLLHLNRIGYYVVLAAAGVVVFAVLHRVIADRTSSHRYATVCCLALAFCYFGSAYVADLIIFFDGIAIGLALGAFAVTSEALAAGLVFLALFTDERALITVVLAVLGYRVVTGRTRLRGAAAGVVAYACVRAGLLLTTDLTAHTEGIGPAVTRDLGWRAPVGVFAAWGGVWLVIGRGFADLRARPFGWLLITGFAAASASAVLVYDVTRSAVYAVPAVIAAMVVLHDRRPAVAEGTGLAAVIVGGFLPGMTVVDQFFWHFPLPYHVLRAFLT